jgi:hypothetical protein
VDVDKHVGAALNRDIAPGAQVDAELDAFISRRSKMLQLEEGERAAEEAWVESTRVHNEKRRQQARHEWHLHHLGQAERLRSTLEALATEHERRAWELASPGGPRRGAGMQHD